MGFFGSLGAEKYDRQYTDRVLVRRIAEYFKPQTVRLVVIAVTILMMSGLGALYPVVVARGVDSVKPEPGRERHPVNLWGRAGDRRCQLAAKLCPQTYYGPGDC